MGNTTAKPKNITYFYDLSEQLGTYNKWCNRVRKVNCVGNLELIRNSEKIAVMGGRKVSNYGEMVIERIVGGMFGVEGLTIYVGDLMGVEKKVIGLLKMSKCPFVYVTKKDIDKSVKEDKWIVENGGLIISVFNMSIPRFLVVEQHNLIAAMAKKVLFFEVASDSNSYKTALKYFDRKIELLTVPYEIGNRCGVGNNLLLKNRVARMILSASDVSQRYITGSIDTDMSIKVIVGTRKYTKILEQIEQGVSDLEEIVQKTEMSMNEVFVGIQELINDGAIKEKEGKYFVV